MIGKVMTEEKMKKLMGENGFGTLTLQCRAVLCYTPSGNEDQNERMLHFSNHSKRKS